MSQTKTKTLKKPTQPLPLSWSRPIEVRFDIEFAPDGRKVTPADIERAAAVAAAAFRTSLEGRSPAYEIARFEVTYDYSYLMCRKQFDA